MRTIACALPVLASNVDKLQVLARELEGRSGEYDDVRLRNGVTREVAFLQRGEHADHLVIYREFGHSLPTPSRSDDTLEAWLKDRLAAIPSFGPIAKPNVELLIRHRPALPGKLYAVALPVIPYQAARLHEWVLELNGIHAALFEESLRRLGHGLTLFVQHTPDVDVVISVVEGNEPGAALRQLAISQHPFDRWYVHQVAELTSVNFSAHLKRPNELLWAWERRRRPNVSD